MKHQLPFIILLLLSLNSFGQEDRKYMYAEVRDKFGAVANAHVINLNTKQGTYTNESGEFRISSKLNDSLKISFVGYKTKTLKVKITHFGIQQNIISIEKIAYELDEVRLKNHDLLGYLSSDSKKIKTKKTIDAKSLNLPYAGSRKLTKAERDLHTAMTSASGIPLDPLINWISGRLKKLKNNKEIEDLEKRIAFINSNYKDYIQHHLKLKNKDVLRFVYYCESDADFKTINYREKVSMFPFLEQKSIEFKNLNPETYQ